MPVVLGRHVRMCMPHGLMRVQVTVASDRHGIVGMSVMRVVVAVRVLVFQRFVLMVVRMAF